MPPRPREEGSVRPFRLCRSRALLLLALMLGGGAQAGGAPQRIVSTNLCTDQLLLMLAPSHRILSVSRLGTDPMLSFMATAAEQYPPNSAGVEELVRLRPDLVLVSEYTANGVVKHLQSRKIRVEKLIAAREVAEIHRNIRQLAGWIGEQKRGEALIRKMDQRLAALAPHPGEAAPAALFLQPNGYTSGTGTLQNEGLRLAGWRNLAAELGLTGYRPLSLEVLVTLRPGALFTSSRSQANNALALRILNHPALRRLNRDHPPYPIDYRYWICGGPMLVDAVAQLAKIRQRLPLHPTPVGENP